jgi:membrane-bound serine protease (ClpP class)
VSPSGGHAGSAGAILLQACHVSGALHGTNLGAATPVSLGQEMPKDLRQKILNDTRSWLEGLTSLRGRSENFGRQIILDAKAVSAEEAAKLNGIDFVGNSVDEFLKFADGREVKMRENKTAQVKLGPIEIFNLDFRYKMLSLLTDPELAYTLFLGSLALLYFEITHPGVYLPGVVGAMGLVVSLLSLNRLEVEWAGMLLLLLGVVMLIAELFLPTMGVLGLGGAGCLFLGSTFLFDPAKTGGYQLPKTLIFPVVIFFILLVVGINFLYLKTRGVKRKGGFEDLIDKVGRVVRVDQTQPQTMGLVEVHGETWKFESTDALNPRDTVKVVGHQGLVLKVNRS